MDPAYLEQRSEIERSLRGKIEVDEDDDPFTPVLASGVVTMDQKNGQKDYCNHSTPIESPREVPRMEEVGPSHARVVVNVPGL